jgi:hypothetical protein
MSTAVVCFHETSTHYLQQETKLKIVVLLSRVERDNKILGEIVNSQLGENCGRLVWKNSTPARFFHARTSNKKKLNASTMLDHCPNYYTSCRMVLAEPTFLYYLCQRMIS